MKMLRRTTMDTTGLLEIEIEFLCTFVCTTPRIFYSNLPRYQILNVLAIERGFIVQYEPKMSGIPSKPGTSDFRYIIVYPMVKRHREDKS